jgi:hypothetical protein
MLSRSNARGFSDDSENSPSARIRSSPQVLADGDNPTKGCVTAPHVGAIGREWPLFPWPRGPLSESVISALQRDPGTLGITPPVEGVDALSDDHFSLALYLCYEVHYRGTTNPRWEWDPALLTFRAELECAFEQRLRDEVVTNANRSPLEIASVHDEMIMSSQGPSLSTYLLETGTLDQFREFCVHRSAYQLKEADPHTFGIPRLTGEAKAAMVEIQYDEYGSGDANSMHSKLFSDTLIALGLDPTYGSYVEVLPGVTLASVNLVSMFALHRRWRAALVGHLAVFEMTSVAPMGRYSKALERFDIGRDGRHFFDVHVMADERHALIARDQLVGGLIRAEPELGADLLFGAAALMMLEQRFAAHLLTAWANDRSSLVPWEMSLP